MPQARPILTIGVTGHRPERIGQGNLEAVAAMIGRVLDAVADAGGADGAPLRMRLVSALAEGADSLAADFALARGWTLDCVLPFGRDDYAADFEGVDALETYRTQLAAARAVFELPGARDPQSDPRAYERAGRVLSLIHI